MTNPRSSNSPKSIPIPPLPELDPPEEETNTLALLLPHQALFQPNILSLLREHYGLFGEIIHWAPVKGFGRVIIVFATNQDAERAKKQGDWLKLDITPNTPSAGGNDHAEQTQFQEENQDERIGQDQTNRTNEKEYFTSKDTQKSRRQSDLLKSNELILRLHYLPPTPLNPDPSSIFLAPPSLPHNFLISPPGSPPEGWEPIQEEGPNTTILAEDLQRALETLQLNGGFSKHNNGGKEVILDEGGVRVEVEDTTKQAPAEEEMIDRWEIEERIDDNTSHDIWNSPKQDSSPTFNLPSHPLPGVGVGGLISGSNTPSGKIRIAPTARPPI